MLLEIISGTTKVNYGKVAIPADKPSFMSESTNTSYYNIQKEDTLWTVFHRLKSVLEVPMNDTSSLESCSGWSSEGGGRHSNNNRSGSNRVSSRLRHDVIYDDSKRVVDMTEIRPNLFIGDE